MMTHHRRHFHQQSRYETCFLCCCESCCCGHVRPPGVGQNVRKDHRRSLLKKQKAPPAGSQHTCRTEKGIYAYHRETEHLLLVSNRPPGGKLLCALVLLLSSPLPQVSSSSVNLSQHKIVYKRRVCDETAARGSGATLYGTRNGPASYSQR